MIQLDWLIDFDGMSTRLEFFYDERNYVHCIFIFTFWCNSLFRGCFFAHSYRISSIPN